MSNSTTVTITNDGTTVTLQAPYSADLPARAKAAGGRFQAATKSWLFDVRDAATVAAIARDIYGTDGSDADEAPVTIRVTDLKGMVDHHDFREAHLLGRTLARRRTRGAAVQLGDGVVVVAGEFPATAGSQKWPALTQDIYCAGITLEVRDLPRSAAERAVLEHPGAVHIVGDDTDRVAVLNAERDALRIRLAELDALLGEH